MTRARDNQPDSDATGPALLSRKEAADELHAAQDVSDATWQQLRARWDDAQLVEIPFVVGQYTMLSMVANATGVAVEGELPPLPDAD